MSENASMRFSPETQDSSLQLRLDSSDLVGAIQQLIDSLPIGNSLPAESGLAERFQVSRLTVREALKVLAGRGLIELSQGRRAVVTEPSSDVISSIFGSYVRRDPSALLELVEVRVALEMQSVSLAARRATRAGLAAMEASLAQMKRASVNFESSARDSHERSEARASFQTADVAFHEAIALSSGNRMLAHVLEALEDTLLRAFFASFEGHLVRGGTPTDTYQAHLAIFEFIQLKDAKQAAGAMREHLQQAEVDLRAVITDTSTAYDQIELGLPLDNL